MFENKKIRLDSNASLILNEYDRFWMLTSGGVDVFSVKVDKNGEYKSSLSYLYSAEKGEVIFSLLIPSEVENDIRIVLVSKGASLVSINKNKLLDINHVFLKNMINNWVNKVIESLFENTPPRVFTSLTHQKSLVLKKDTIAYPVKDIVWCKVLEGSCIKYADKKLKMSAEEEFNFPFVVSKVFYTKALSNKNTIEILTTREFLKDEIFFMLSMNNLQQHLYGRLVEKFSIKNENAKKRIIEKVNLEEEKLSKTLDHLQSIVSRKNKKSNTLNIDISNTLLKACQFIGDEVGFKFEYPKYLGSLEGSAITNQLYAISQASNVRTRKIILRDTWWKEENGHLLAFYKNSKEPVALIQKTSNTYILKETKSGKEIKIDYKVAENLEPICYMFFYGFNGVLSSVKQIGRFALQGIKKDSKFLILAALAGSLMGLLVPILSGVMFDDVIPTADRSLLIQVFLIMVMIGLVTAGLQLIQGVLQLRVETKSSINLQAGVIDHLLRLPVAFYRKYTAGDLTNRALSINAIRQILSSTVLTAVLSGGFSFVNLGLLFYYDSSLAWIGLGMAFVAVAFMTIIGWLKLKYDREISDIQGELQGFLFEFLSGVTKIRITGGEKRIFRLWASKFSKLKRLGFNSGNYQNYVEIFNNSYPLLTNMFFFGFIYYTLSNTTDAGSVISVGVFMAFISAFNQFLRDCLKMSIALITSLSVVTLYERVKPILEEETESLEQSLDPGELTGSIEMNSISFRYHKDQPLVLNNLSLTINQGEMIAFVGASGSGKSTIMRLLLGFEEPEVGSIYYDGNAYDSMNKELVRRQIGVVLQNGSLMSGSIYKNIVGNSELTLEDAWEAARMAGIEEDIRQMPMEMHTVISEGASTFSGGQRQRLMIARAIAHKPRLLFMDEATSALDNKTQSIVSESLDKLQATRIVIAHRLSTVKNADKIYVLDKGMIVESGNYDELMKMKGVFLKLVKRQIA